MEFFRRHAGWGAVALGCLLAGCDNPAAMNRSSSNVKYVSQDNFTNDVIHGSRPAVVDFYATWCPPCRVLSRELDGLAGAYTNKINFFKVNVDEAPQLAQTFQTVELPFVLFLTNGAVADLIVGLPDETELKTRLAAFAAAK
jgi:thioredoxin 1